MDIQLIKQEYYDLYNLFKRLIYKSIDKHVQELINDTEIVSISFLVEDNYYNDENFDFKVSPESGYIKFKNGEELYIDDILYGGTKEEKKITKNFCDLINSIPEDFLRLFRAEKTVELYLLIIN